MTDDTRSLYQLMARPVNHRVIGQKEQVRQRAIELGETLQPETLNPETLNPETLAPEQLS